MGKWVAVLYSGSWLVGVREVYLLLFLGETGRLSLGELEDLLLGNKITAAATIPTTKAPNNK